MKSKLSSISAYNFSQRVHNVPVVYKIGRAQKHPLFYEEVGLDFDKESFDAVYADLSQGDKYDREFNPFYRYPGLYRTVGETGDDEESILNFVRTYGFLTKPLQLLVTRPAIGEGRLAGLKAAPNELIRGENLSTVRKQFSEMRKAVLILDCLQNSIQNASRPKLLDIFKRSDDETWAFFHTAGKSWHDVVRNVEGFSVEQVAITQLQVIINRHLLEHAVPRLLVERKALESERSFSRPRLYLNPLSLTGVAWIQIAQAVSNADDLAQCTECGTWFSRNVRNGKDKLYCSGACRTRAARRRAKA